MPNELRQDPRTNFAVRRLPWILGTVMFLIYACTLNPWVTLMNLNQVAVACGWTWQPQLTNPLIYLAMLPFRMVADSIMPVALNIFSAMCGALVLVLLARSIAILPHDRMEMERQRERSDFSFLTGPESLFPPIVTVALAGLQLSFWERVTNFTGESLELLIFAMVIWLLLEYRLDESPWRLYLAAFAYGTGMVEDWAFVGYFPVFVAAVIWQRKLGFFNVEFLGKMFLCGLGGTLLLFLLPIKTMVTGEYPLSLGYMLRLELISDGNLIHGMTYPWAWKQLGIMSLPTLLPVLMMSIRWSANFGDSSAAGKALVNYLLYFVHAGFIAICGWVMFDPRFSPKQLALFGASGLTFYYLAALGIGYFSGFFLVVFGRRPIASRRGSRRTDSALPEGLMWICPWIVAGTYGWAAISVGLLMYKNFPIIRSINDRTLQNYARYTTQKLPPQGAILLCDLEAGFNQPVHGYLIEAMLAKEGLTAKYPVVNTYALKNSIYHAYLHQRYPQTWPLLYKEKKPTIFNTVGLATLINLLAKSNTICYLNPSVGYYFESFYAEPHGLIYNLKWLSKETLLPPLPDKSLISENETFWNEVVQAESPGIQKAVAPPNPERHPGIGERLLMHLHVVPEPNPNAIYAGTIYSRALNFWGVQLQRAGELDLAAAHFEEAQRLNPDNVTVGINLQFNKELRSGNIPAIDLTQTGPDQFGKEHSWQEVSAANGPFDEVSFTFKDGLILANENGLYRQSVALFKRVMQLAPNDLGVRLQLAQCYVASQMPDFALKVLQDPMNDPERFSLTQDRTMQMNVLVAAVYFEKKENERAVELLEGELERHPGDDTLLQASVQACLRHGLTTNALEFINHRLAQTPNDPKWIFAKGTVELELGQLEPAISLLTEVVELQTNNPAARFNRALAYLDTGNLAGAKTDYLFLQSTYPNSFQIAYGLGEIAWREHDTNEVIRNYQIYLGNANTNTAEAKGVRTRLQELGK